MATQVSGPFQVNIGTNTAASDSIQLVSGDLTNPTTQLQISSIANAAAANVPTIINNSMGQATSFKLVDPGVASTNFINSDGPTSTKTDFSEFVGVGKILMFTAGTWTTTRIAEANIVSRHTAAANTSIIVMDITDNIRTTASKGFKLNSIDVIYSIGTLALNAHTATLDMVNYANNAAVTITSVPITGTLATATQANPYLTNLAVTTPAYLTTVDSKYVFELTVNAQATSAYDFYGINLNFTRSDL